MMLMKKWKDIETKNKIQSRYSIKEFNFLKHKFNSFLKIILILGIYSGILPV